MSEKEMDVPVVTLTLEDDSELECAVLAVFPVEGYEGEYAALLPVDALEDESEEGDIFLYRYKVIDEDNLDITNIEDDDEFEAVSEAFDAILDEEEFNSL